MIYRRARQITVMFREGLLQFLERFVFVTKRGANQCEIVWSDNPTIMSDLIPLFGCAAR